MKGYILCLLAIASICSAQGPPFTSPRWPQTTGTSSSFPPYSWPHGNPTGPCTTVPTGPHPPFSISTTSTSQTSTPTQAPACPTIQNNFASDANSSSTRTNAVKSAYLKSWKQYSDHCFGHDTLVVTNNTCKDDLFGWGATIVDAIDTAIVMGLTDIVKGQLAHIAAVDFTKAGNGASQLVGTFDVIIRYLGGLLSAYDLLTSDPYNKSNVYDQSHVAALLSQAVILAGKIKPQFKTATGLPTGAVWFNNDTLEYSNYDNPLDNKTYRSVCPAVAGTILLEFYRLSDLTGDASYRQLADRAEEWILNPYPEPAYPFLIGRQMDVDTGVFLTYDFGWSAEIDSFFEQPPHLTYTLKFGSTVQSTLEHIVVSPYQWPELTFVTEGDPAANPKDSMDTYSCFAGGNILYGAAYLDKASNVTSATDISEFRDLGLNVTASCRHLYATTVSGLGPGGWAWFDAANKTYNDSWAVNGDYQYSAETRGYFITGSEYDSFPETIESIFYAWRITGDQKYQDWNWEIFQSLMGEQNESEGGNVVYGSISDVDVPGSFEDELPTFYFAETLKYLYLSFVDPGIISLDEWVFNTECHPLRIGGVKSCVKS